MAIAVFKFINARYTERNFTIVQFLVRSFFFFFLGVKTSYIRTY
jgi:hypothetical protein